MPGQIGLFAIFSTQALQKKNYNNFCDYCNLPSCLNNILQSFFRSDNNPLNVAPGPVPLRVSLDLICFVNLRPTQTNERHYQGY